MFYNTFIQLCNKANIAPTAAAIEMGFQKSVVTRWKNGTVPRDINLKKVADYFNVSVEYLINGTEDSTPQPPITFDDFTYAMYNHSAELSDDEKQMLLGLANMMRERKRTNND